MYNNYYISSVSCFAFFNDLVYNNAYHRIKFGDNLLGTTNLESSVLNKLVKAGNYIGREIIAVHAHYFPQRHFWDPTTQRLSSIRIAYPLALS